MAGSYNSRTLKLEVPKWRHNHSQCPAFGLAVLYPTGSEIWRFWYIKTRGKKITIKNFSLLYKSVHRGDLIEQIKKICQIHFKSWLCCCSLATLAPKQKGSTSLFTRMHCISPECTAPLFTRVHCVTSYTKMSHHLLVWIPVRKVIKWWLWFALICL